MKVAIDSRSREVSFNPLAFREELSAESCSVCLEDFERSDELMGHKVLPQKQEEKESEQSDIYHVFHERCVGPWLARKGKCPVCIAPMQGFVPPAAEPVDRITALVANYEDQVTAATMTSRLHKDRIICIEKKAKGAFKRTLSTFLFAIAALVIKVVASTVPYVFPILMLSLSLTALTMLQSYICLSQYSDELVLLDRSLILINQAEVDLRGAQNLERRVIEARRRNFVELEHRAHARKWKRVLKVACTLVGSGIFLYAAKRFQQNFALGRMIRA